MNDYYLKFNNKQEMWNNLLEQGLAIETENMVSDGAGGYDRERVAVGVALDVIGTIYKPTGNMTTTTSDMGEFTFPEVAPIDGFHANIRGTLTEEQQNALPLIEKPTTPYRVWA
jgi:hypothetical protein